MGKSGIKKALLVFLIIFGSFSVIDEVKAADELNCILCHKYRGLSRIDKTGKFRLFFINHNMFSMSPHGKVKCNDCHRDINVVPHEPAQKVNCTIECHIIEPSGQRRFSHQSIEDNLFQSAHSKYDKDGNLKEMSEDYPHCKDCHEQPIYRPLSFFKGSKPGVSERAIARCKTCHRTGRFANIFYTHVTSRLQKTRRPREIVAVCAKCHGDKAFQKRHKLDDVVTSYFETFHGKAVNHGSERTPDCVDCHIRPGDNVHLIESKTSPTAAVNLENRAMTCRVKDCHVDAGENLSGYHVHVTYDDPEKYPIEYYLLLFFTLLTGGTMYFFLTIIFLELIRRFFPHASLFKSKDH